jgi:hypothetical protein
LATGGAPYTGSTSSPRAEHPVEAAIPQDAAVVHAERDDLIVAVLNEEQVSVGDDRIDGLDGRLQSRCARRVFGCVRHAPQSRAGADQDPAACPRNPQELIRRRIDVDRLDVAGGGVDALQRSIAGRDVNESSRCCVKRRLTDIPAPDRAARVGLHAVRHVPRAVILARELNDRQSDDDRRSLAAPDGHAPPQLPRRRVQCVELAPVVPEIAAAEERCADGDRGRSRFGITREQDRAASAERPLVAVFRGLRSAAGNAEDYRYANRDANAHREGVYLTTT